MQAKLLEEVAAILDIVPRLAFVEVVFDILDECGGFVDRCTIRCRQEVRHEISLLLLLTLLGLLPHALQFSHHLLALLLLDRFYGIFALLQREPVQHLRLHKGVHEFVCNQSVCQQLANFLEDQKNYTEEGFLNIAGTTWPGYGGYPYVHAHLGHMPCQQQARTVRVAKKADVDFILSNEPLVQALLWQVRDRLHLPQPSGRDVQPPGKCVRVMHFLLQDATQQAVFSWHDDADDIKCRGMLEECLRAMTTVIVNLSDECSGMRIWGHDPVLYRRVGDAVAFPGAALHETVPRRATCPAKRVVRKVAFFFL